MNLILHPDSAVVIVVRSNVHKKISTVVELQNFPVALSGRASISSSKSHWFPEKYNNQKTVIDLQDSAI